MDVADVTVEEVNAFAAAELPFCTQLGIRCDALARDEALARWRFSRRFARPVDFASGGVIMALADVALYFAIFTLGGIVPLALTSELKVNFLRPAAGPRDLLARARILKRGRRVVYGLVDVYQDGAPERLVAQATTSYLMPE